MTRSGILLLDKPSGITSHDAVSRTRRAAGTRKVGHAGTLDPMATGLLVLGINSSTRLLTFVVGLDKEYLATIRLGASTTTDDREGEPVFAATPRSLGAVTDPMIGQQIEALSGDIDQIPSSVSAVKVDGRRAYARVRAGEEVELASRRVSVTAFELLESRPVDGMIDLDVRVECSSGTYIRALARDLGAALGVGGHLTALRRTRIGPFSIEDAASLETLQLPAALLAPADTARLLFPVADLNPQQTIDLGHGKRIELPELSDASPVAAIAPDGSLTGLMEVVGGCGRTLVNFPADETASTASASS